jgi:hypothetical protein
MKYRKAKTNKPTKRTSIVSSNVTPQIGASAPATTSTLLTTKIEEEQAPASAESADEPEKTVTVQTQQATEVGKTEATEVEKATAGSTKKRKPTIWHSMRAIVVRKPEITAKEVVQELTSAGFVDAEQKISTIKTYRNDILEILMVARECGWSSPAIAQGISQPESTRQTASLRE